MSPKMHNPDEQRNGQGDASQDHEGEADEFEIDVGDIEEVIELDEQPTGDDVMGELGDMELRDEDDDEGMDGAESSQPPRDDAKTIFSKHKGSVFCIDAEPVHGKVAVTGGEDDLAYVWDINDGHILFECTGHKDSVTCASFSFDGKYVATADMSGMIQVWQLSTMKVVWSFQIGDLEWIEWHPVAPVLLAGSVEGDMWMWKIPSGETKTFQSHGCTCNIAKVLPNGKQACAGYNDGALKMWDLKTGAVLHNVTGHMAHTDSITSMDIHPTEQLLVTGSTDLTAKLTNTTNGKVVATYNCSTGEEEDSVEAVGFASGLPLVATGTLSGTLTLWDVSAQVARQQCKHEGGIVRLKWNDSASVVYTCTLDGVVHAWDGRNGQLVQQFYGHSAEILDFHLTRDNTSILTAAGDGTARMFKLNT